MVYTFIVLKVLFRKMVISRLLLQLLYSLLNNKKKNDVAITGEITLSGDITGIGGLDIKISSGIRNGIKFLFPKENEREFQIWIEKTEVKNNIEFIKISNIKVFNKSLLNFICIYHI